MASERGTDRPAPSADLGQLRERSPEPLSSPQTLGVWELAWPTIVSFATHTLVRWADFIMVGSLGAEALAAVGLGGQLYWLIQSIGTLVPTGLTAVLARAVGARDTERADAALRQALLLAAAIGTLTTFCGLPLAARAVGIYGVEPMVVQLGGNYLTWLLVGTAPLSMGLVFATALRAAGDPRTPLIIGVLANLINVSLNWLLIYGRLGMPALGVAGAAIASSIAMVLQLAAFWWLWSSRRLALRPGGGSFRPHRELISRMLRIGFPAAVEGGVFQTGLMWFQRLVGVYGTSAVAAYNVGVQILALAFLPGMGFSSAAGTLVGQHLGDDNPAAAARSGWRSAVGAMLCMTTLGLTVIVFARPIATLFTSDPRVIDLTVDFIRILGAVQPLMALEFALAGALRGAGDTIYPLLVIFIGLFLARLLPATLLTRVFAAPVQVVWGALVLDYLVKATLLVLRFRGERWRSIEA